MLFCQKLTDLNHPETCVHFAEDYVDKSCSAFVQVDNVEKRLQESLAVKAVTPNTKKPMAASRKETEEKIKFQKKQAVGIGKASLVQREVSAEEADGGIGRM